MFDAVVEEYAMNFADEESSTQSLRETQARLADAEEALEESETSRKEVERVIELERILAPLVGRQHEVMEAILRTVPTEQLEEGYKTFIGRVIRESDISEKEGSVLAEGKDEECDDDDDKDDDKKSKKSKKDDDKDDDDKVEEGILRTGDTAELMENFDVEQISEATKELRKLAGIE